MAAVQLLAPLFCLQFSILFFFFLPFFGFQDKHWGRGKQRCLSWHCSHTLQSEKLRNGRDSMFPAGCSGDLKTCLCQVSERPPGPVTPPHSLLPCLPLKAARRSCAEVQAYVGGCSRCCWQSVPAGMEPLAPAWPVHPAHLKSSQGCKGQLQRVPATRQDQLPLNSKPSSTARRHWFMCPGQLKKEPSSLSSPARKPLPKLVRGWKRDKDIKGTQGAQLSAGQAGLGMACSKERCVGATRRGTVTARR